VRTGAITCTLVLVLTVFSSAQNAVERSFPVPASTLQSLLKQLPGGTAGPLPSLEGFVTSGQRSLDQYRRPYYQCTIRITAGPSGGSVAAVKTTITAWNKDPAHPKYEVLESNGRIESDLLDRLQDLVAVQSTSNTESSQAAKTPPTAHAKAEPPPDISAPVRQMPSVHELVARGLHTPEAVDPALQRQAKSLEEILRNQTHPTNLVAVKQEETPVLQNPSTDSTVLFLANAEDEFEVLTLRPDWVYVRISGLSRGWIRRSHVEVLDDSAVAGDQQKAGNSAPASPGLFTVSSEAVASFPGEWAPLKGKNVAIISVQQLPGTGLGTSSEEKLRFAEAEFKQVLSSSASADGVVVIFDSEDGGMIAATRASLQQWKSGTVSDRAFWTQCYFDPPEIFASANR
jgi:hypothetical protein